MTGWAACLPRWRWWLLLPVMIPLFLAIKACDKLGYGLYRLSVPIWNWAFK